PALRDLDRARCARARLRHRCRAHARRRRRVFQRALARRRRSRRPRDRAGDALAPHRQARVVGGAGDHGVLRDRRHADPAAPVGRAARADDEGLADPRVQPHAAGDPGGAMITTYFVLKYLHVIGAAVLMGTGAGIAFFMLLAHRTRNPAVVAGVARIVVIADFLFTATAVVLQPITGWLLARETGWS